LGLPVFTHNQLILLLILYVTVDRPTVFRKKVTSNFFNEKNNFLKIFFKCNSDSVFCHSTNIVVHCVHVTCVLWPRTLYTTIRILIWSPGVFNTSFLGILTINAYINVQRCGLAISSTPYLFMGRLVVAHLILPFRDIKVLNWRETQTKVPQRILSIGQLI
jgi:hypothetical protein